MTGPKAEVYGFVSWASSFVAYGKIFFDVDINLSLKKKRFIVHHHQCPLLQMILTTLTLLCFNQLFLFVQ
jgi:hypothetical protein